MFEWAEHVERLKPGSVEFDDWVADQRRRGFAVHNHVWVLQDVLEILVHLREIYGVAFRLVRWSNTSLFGNEFTLLLRKADAGAWRLRVAKIAAVASHPTHELISLVRRAWK